MREEEAIEKIEEVEESFFERISLTEEEMKAVDSFAENLKIGFREEFK